MPSSYRNKTKAELLLLLISKDNRIENLQEDVKQEKSNFQIARTNAEKWMAQVKTTRRGKCATGFTPTGWRILLQIFVWPSTNTKRDIRDGTAPDEVYIGLDKRLCEAGGLVVTNLGPIPDEPIAQRPQTTPEQVVAALTKRPDLYQSVLRLMIGKGQIAGPWQQAVAGDGNSKFYRYMGQQLDGPVTCAEVWTNPNAVEGWGWSVWNPDLDVEDGAHGCLDAAAAQCAADACLISTGWVIL